MSDALFALLEFEQEMRRCASERETLFAAANSTHRLISFQDAALWLRNDLNRVTPTVFSGLAEIEPNAPYALWLTRVWEHCAALPDEAATPVALGDLPPELAEDGAEWLPGHMLYCPLRGADGKVFGGLSLMRAAPFVQEEAAQAAWIAGVVGHALWAWRRKRLRLPHLRWRDIPESRRWRIAAAIFMALIFPVRISALAPAEISPLDPVPIAAPIEGAVARFHVAPNTAVKAGDLLVSLDDTTLRNRLDVSRKTLEVARADLLRAGQKAFSDDAGKAELQILKARVDEKSAEATYAEEMLARIHMRAPQDGIAIYGNADDWVGRPVMTGEKIVTLADPARVGMTIHLPADDAIQLETGGDVKLFLNVSPVFALAGKITQTSYEAAPTPEGVLAYTLKASLDEDGSPPRIGLKGTAKVYGSSVPLIYYLVRRPILQLRRALGL